MEALSHIAFNLEYKPRNNTSKPEEGISPKTGQTPVFLAMLKTIIMRFLRIFSGQYYNFM